MYVTLAVQVPSVKLRRNPEVKFDGDARATGLVKISVVVPTYFRPDALRRCLQALIVQQRPADEIVVIIHTGDAESTSLMNQTRAFSNLTVATVGRPGQVGACNQGLATARGDIIAITDDDAVPRSDWLARIEKHFLADPRIGAVGGRDWVDGDGSVQKQSGLVGKVMWFGRPVGNHHLGSGQSREVEILKGANMSYRRAAIDGVRFDERLRGEGAQVHNDLAFSLAVKRSGWRLIYDPAVAVDHFPAPRRGLQRAEFDPQSVADAAHNETLALLDYLPPKRRVVFLLWALLFGSRSAFGLAQCVRFLPRERLVAIRKLEASLRGRWAGVQTWASQHHPARSRDHTGA